MFNIKSVLAGMALAVALTVPAALVAGGTSAVGSKPHPLPQGTAWNAKSGAVEWAQLKGQVTLIDFWNHR